MLHSLGVQPTAQDITQMMSAADTGDSDGRIDMREFLEWYACGLQKDRNHEKEDCQDAFRAIYNADTGLEKMAPTKGTDQPERLRKEQLRAFLVQEYGLDYTPDELNEVSIM